MKTTITLCAVVGLAIAGTPEPAWMVLSGASLLTAASLVRRYAP